MHKNLEIISRGLDNAQKLITFLKKEGWSEEDIVKAIELLHSHFEKQTFI